MQKAGEVGKVLLKGDCVFQDLEGDLYIGTKYETEVTSEAGEAAGGASASATPKGHKFLEICKVGTQFLGFRISRAPRQQMVKIQRAGLHDPPRFFLPYNAQTTLLVRPVAELQAEPCWPLDQRDLHIDFTCKKGRTRGVTKKVKKAQGKGKGKVKGEKQKTTQDEGDCGDEAATPAPLLVEENIIGEWYQQEQCEGAIPLGEAIFFGHVSYPVVLTVPERIKQRKKKPGEAEKAFEDILKYTLISIESETKVANGYQYLGYYSNKSQVNIAFNGSESLTYIDFTVVNLIEKKDEIHRGFRIVHSFGPLHPDLKLPKQAFPAREDGISLEQIEGVTYGNVFMMFAFSDDAVAGSATFEEAMDMGTIEGKKEDKKEEEGKVEEGMEGEKEVKEEEMEKEGKEKKKRKKKKRKQITDAGKVSASVLLEEAMEMGTSEGQEEERNEEGVGEYVKEENGKEEEIGIGDKEEVKPEEVEKEGKQKKKKRKKGKKKENTEN